MTGSHIPHADPSPRHHHDHRGDGVANRWLLSAHATLHCLIGCVIGEVLGLMIGVSLGIGVCGPTVAARCEAAAHLSQSDRPEVVRALTTVAIDGAAFWGVRVEAARALGTMRSQRARTALLRLLAWQRADASPDAAMLYARAFTGMERFDALEDLLTYTNE